MYETAINEAKHSLYERFGTIFNSISLIKPRIVALLIFVAGATSIIAYQGFPPWNRILPLLMAGGLASAGASLLNNYFDRDIDALMERTRGRPLPAGRIKQPSWALGAGILLVLLSLPFSISLNFQVALYTLLGAFFYVVVYTMGLKRRSWTNVVIGGFAGSCAVLAGWVAVSPEFNYLAFSIALLVFLWTPLHFWNFSLVYLKDYKRSGLPMLPVVKGVTKTCRSILITAVIVFIISLSPYLLGYAGLVYLLLALGLGSLLYGNILLLYEANSKRAWKNYKLSGIYLAGLFFALAMDALI